MAASEKVCTCTTNCWKIFWKYSKGRRWQREVLATLSPQPLLGSNGLFSLRDFWLDGLFLMKRKRNETKRKETCVTQKIAAIGWRIRILACFYSFFNVVPCPPALRFTISRRTGGLLGRGFYAQMVPFDE